MSDLNWGKLTEKEKNDEISRNNPSKQPTGDFTGRCYRCGSADLWDDNLTYGCNRCGMIKFPR